MSDRHRSSIRWAIFGLVLSVVLIVIKLVGYWITNSATVLADALESCVHLVTSTFALFAVWLSAKPGDANHPYGHGKVEYLSAGLEGMLVLLTGIGIIFIGVQRLLNPVELPSVELGAAVELLAAAVAFAGGTALMRAGTRNQSPTIHADGVHIRSDAITSVAGFIGVGLVAITGEHWIDPVVAILLAFFLIVSGASVVRRSVGGLMDEARPELLTELLGVLTDVRGSGWLTPHALKVHRLGQLFHVDLHIVFPRFWDLQRAHTESHRLTDAVQARWGERTETMVHAEPCKPHHCPWCDVAECPVRSAPFDEAPEWTLEAVTSRAPPLPPGVEPESG